MFKGWFRNRQGNGHCRRGRSEDRCCAHSLHDFAKDAQVTVISNSDRKTLEMGICTGARIRVIENRPSDANMVIDAGEGRYILAKDTAAKIRVC